MWQSRCGWTALTSESCFCATGLTARAGTRPQQYYEGQVSHFTVWNADQPYETIYINGCVVNTAGQPVDASVVSEGIDYYGSASTVTSADGKFKVAARRSSQVQVTAQSGGGTAFRINFPPL